jgi:GrpB-like predicted nucleotidyltransferase (UPF0157 family)
MWVQPRYNPDERILYVQAKRRAATVSDGSDYNDAKAAVIYDIYERAFAADPNHEHTPRPR